MIKKELSAIIPAGGYGRRMGRRKEKLDFHGVSLLEHQIEKLRGIGIRDIVVAGCTGLQEGARTVPDVYPHRGPLSGIHAGLCAICNPGALVLAVDMPLVPAELLEDLAESAGGDITLVQCRGKLQPLLGVYDRRLTGICEALLQKEDTSLRRLFREVGVRTVDYTGDEALLRNCNTPEDYRAALEFRG